MLSIQETSARRKHAALALVISAIACWLSPAAAQLPNSFVVTVNDNTGTPVQLNLSKHSVRPPNFRVVSWHSTNGYVEEHTAANPALPARTYRGFITQDPNKLVLAVVRVNNTLDAEVHNGSGRLWTVSGVNVATELGNGTATIPPPAPLAPGPAATGSMAGGVPTTYIPPVGLYTAHGVEDVTSQFYDQNGQSVEASLAWVEHQWNILDFFNSRDAKLNMQLTEVIIRKQQFYTPASGNAGQFNSMLRAEWLARGQNTRGFIHSWFPYNFTVAGGYASGNSFYNPGGEAVSVNALYHELAHNWRAQHYYYGRDTMSGSHPAHGEMNAMRVLAERQQESAEVGMVATTSYPTNLHPRAFIDLTTTLVNTPVNISPMANDWDANGDTLSIKTHTATTAKGGTVTKSAGVLTYTPAAGYVGKDMIVYEVRDTAGLYTQGLIHIEVINNGLAARWSMEETSGTIATDASGNGHAGALASANFTTDSVPGPVGNAIRLASGGSITADASDLIIEPETAYPLESAASNFFDPMNQSFSASCWFKLDAGGTAVLMSKRNQGFFGYHLTASTDGLSAVVRPWDGNAGWHTVASGPLVQEAWYHASMVINRSDNTLRLYLNGQETGSAATLPADLFIFNGREDLTIGGNTAVSLDEVQIHTKALNLTEIQALHNAGDIPAAPISPSSTLNQPTNSTLSWLTGNASYLYNVYFGTDAAAVAAATTASPEFKGQQAGTTYNPGTLAYGTNYYWRIDGVNGATIIPSAVWKFSTAATILTENLVLHLTMDGEDVQTADPLAEDTHSFDDIAAPAQDFISINATPGAAGVIGEAVDLGLTTDSLRSHGASTIVRPPTGGMTISFWINTTSALSGYVYDLEGACFLSYTNGDLKPVFDGSSSGATTFNTNINDGLWHHVVATNNGAGLTTLYVDGVPAGTQSESLYNLASLNREMSIGAIHDGSSDNMAASYDDFAVWERALSPTEITAIRTAGLTGNTFNDVPILVDSSFEPAEGFSGFNVGNHSSLGTKVDNDGVTWAEVADARIWNRSDIPPDGAQVLTLGLNASTSRCDVRIPGSTHGMGIVSFDYASFSDSTNASFRLLYNNNAGSGWVEAWSTRIVSFDPDFEEIPWRTAEVAINVTGNVDLRFETIGTKGAMIDNVKVTGLVLSQNQAPTANDTSGTVAENNGAGIAVASVAATDPDAGDSLFYTITGGNGGGLFAINGSGNIITTANLDFEAAGQHLLTVTVSDSKGLFDTATVTVNVTNNNDAPVFTSDPIVGTGGTVFSPHSGTIAGKATDQDTANTLTYTKAGGPAWLMIASNGTLSGTPPGSAGGLNSFTVNVSDANGGTDQATLQITISTSGTVFLENFQSYDVENPADFSVSAAPTGNWTNNNTGTNATRIYNTSNFGGTRLWITNVDGTTLTNAGVPVGPNADYTMSVVLVTEAGSGAQSVNANFDILVGPTAGTAVSMIGGPQVVVAHGDSWVTDNSKTDHLFTHNFQTGALNPGDLLFVRFTRLSNGGGIGGWFGVDDVKIDLNSVNSNSPPTWNTSPVNEIAATKGVAYGTTLANDTTDLNLDPLTYTKVSGPAWLTVASSGTLSGTPGSGDIGPNSWTVHVSDGIAPPVQVTLNITAHGDNDGDGNPDLTDPDDDNDGIPDVWETARGLNPLANDAAADPDGDGQDNASEYVTDTDPHDSASKQSLSLTIAPSTGDVTIRFPTSAFRNYQVATHPDLSDTPWQPLGPVLTGTGGELTVPDSTGLPRRFYRLQTTIP